MSTLRTDMLALKDDLIGLRLPSQLDQAVHQLTIRTRTWAGGAQDVGPFTDADLVLPKKYRMRQLTTREVETSGGRLEMGDIIFEGLVPNDPANGSIGFTPAQLQPHIVQGQEVIYIVTGPHNGLYALIELRTSKTYAYAVVLRRRIDQPVVT